jgi:small-conductance mechanosensitive channel
MGVIGMLRKIGFVIILLVVAALVFIINLQYLPHQYFPKIFYSLIALAIVYLLFKVIVEGTAVRHIKDSKSRYAARKTISIVYVIIFFVVFGVIWIEDAQSLVVVYGLLAAGIAIALQDLFKNFAGGMIILLNRPYSVGDRIEIDNKYGDVMDIGIMYTTIMEMRGWVDGDQATGRITLIPNGAIIGNPVSNYTKDHNFIWDELKIPLTYDSDWNEAITRVMKIVKSETGAIIKKAAKDISRLEEKYYLDTKPTDPAVFLKITDNWIELGIRYITETRQRRVISDKINRMLLETISKSDNIKIASATMDVTVRQPS